MKSTTNRYQRNYMMAKAQLETLESIMNDMEREYIKAHGIVNDNGESPKAIYCIDDEATFNRVNAECGELPEFKSNFAEQLEARKTLEAAENMLVEYGLSIAPAKEREILRKSASENYTTKEKIISMVMKLDVSTVRA